MEADSPDANDRLIVGLTGGIASGKSLVADLFADFGVTIVDTDIVAREVVAPGSPALEEIRQSFGDQVVADDGTLDRAAMRKIVFSDDAQRQVLEAILHPRIRDESFRQVDAATAAYVIVVVPLLYESPMKEAMHRILVVDCGEETQIERLMARDNETREQACRILATQASREERLSIADDVIQNNGDIESVRQAVQQLHERYLELANLKTN
ncbi:MAG: dephospho-CoA kinase [Woeseiaceae bacterium]